MRRFTLAGTFLMLLGGLYLLWQWRFERSPVLPTFVLEDMRAHSSGGAGVSWSGQGGETRLRLRVDAANPKGIVRMALPGVMAADYLHLRFRVAGAHLVPGQEVWEDGRCIVEWHQPAGGAWENDPFCSVRYSFDDGVQEVVMRPEVAPAIPSIRIENLGVSGEVVISMLEATVVRERMVWKIGKWLLLAGWLTWAMACVRTMDGTRGWRTLLAGGVWLVMGIYFVIPGPWKALRSFPSHFQMGPEVRLPIPPPAPPSASPVQQASGETTSPVLESVGKIPDKGDFTLKVKVHAAKVRPLLHVALLLGPALLLALLVGNRSAILLSVVLAASIELAQMAFGYGFDLMDVGDLACDSAGIALAIFIANRLRARFALRASVGAEPTVGMLSSVRGD